MEFKGTKGEWKVNKYNNVSSKYELPIAVVYDGSTAHNSFRESNKELCKANAKLISCAPEMLDFIQYLIGESEDLVHTEIQKQATELIKKATEI
jgi:hypothetical protein